MTCERAKKGFLPDVDFSDCPWTIESFPKFDGPLIFFFVKIVYSYKLSKLQTAKEYTKKQVAKLFFLYCCNVFLFLKVYRTQPINDSVSQTIHSWSYSCWLTFIAKEEDIFYVWQWESSITYEFVHIIIQFRRLIKKKLRRLKLWKFLMNIYMPHLYASNDL